MGRINQLKYKDLEVVLKRIDFVNVRMKGSHSLWKHADGRVVVISIHKGKNVKVGLVHKIITKEIGITIDDFYKILKGK